MNSRFRGFLPVVVDVETGGFNAATDAILEVAASLVAMDEHGDLYLAGTRSYQVAPFDGANIEKAAIEFTGIDPFHPLRDAQPEADVFDDLFRWIRRAVKEQGCRRAVLVGHNAHFDHGFVKAAVARHDLKRDPFHPFSSFDTASLAGLAYGQTVLAKACLTAGIPFSNREAHSAAYDTERTAELFCNIVNRYRQLGGADWLTTEKSGA